MHDGHPSGVVIRTLEAVLLGAAALLTHSVGSAQTVETPSASTEVIQLDHDLDQEPALVATDDPAQRSTSADATLRPIRIDGLQLVHRDGGWIAGESRLMWTDDAGRSWVDITPPGRERTVLGGHFHDRGLGWVLLRSEPADEQSSPVLEVAFTESGGANWSFATLLDDPTLATATLASIQFVDASHGWIMLRLPSSASFSHGLLLATLDGGRSWRQLPSPPSGNAARFLSATNGWLTVGPEHDSLHATIDGGHTWRPAEFDTPPGIAPEAERQFDLPEIRAGRITLRVAFREGTSTTFVLAHSKDAGTSWSPGEPFPLGDEVQPGIRIPATTLEGGETLIGVPGRNELRLLNGKDGSMKSLPIADLPETTAVRKLEFDDATQGWMLLAEGRCAGFKRDCRQESRLLHTRDVGRTLVDITPRIDVTPAPKATSTSQNDGFDKCAAATVGQMQTWWSTSPYRDVNIYIGGRNRACGQVNLNAAWVSAVFAQGWKLIPTWVGYQAPGSSCGSCAIMSTNTATARQQGIDEANAAADVAASLGLHPQTIVYFNMEQYNGSSPAVSAFLDGWTQRMRQRGNLSGVYGAATNAQNDWHGIANVADAVWIARWDNRKTVWGLSPLSDSLWPNHQRIHQYRGGHNETYGGVTFNIDSNVEDAPLASRGATRDDLMSVKFNGTPTGVTEAHVLSGASNYTAWKLNTTTAFGQVTPEQFSFAFADYNRDGIADLYGISRAGWSLPSTHLIVTSGASNYKTQLLSIGTPLGPVREDQFSFAFGDHDSDGVPDLYAISRQAWGVWPSTTVIVLSGASNYQTTIAAHVTPLHLTWPESFSFEVGDYNRDGISDLYAIKRLQTGTNSIEVHVLSGASNFQSWLLNTGTPFGQVSPDQFSFHLGNYDGDGIPDLYGISRNYAGWPNTVVYVMSGASNYQIALTGVTTPLHFTVPANFSFDLGLR